MTIRNPLDFKKLPNQQDQQGKTLKREQGRVHTFLEVFKQSLITVTFADTGLEFGSCTGTPDCDGSSGNPCSSFTFDLRIAHNYPYVDENKLPHVFVDLVNNDGETVSRLDMGPSALEVSVGRTYITIKGLDVTGSGDLDGKTMKIRVIVIYSPIVLPSVPEDTYTPTASNGGCNLFAGTFFATL